MKRPSILIIKLSSVGDVVMATPAVHQIKRHTNARIVWAVDEGIAPLLDGHPDIDQLFLFPRDPFRFLTFDPMRVLPAAARLLGDLRRDHFDIALDLQGRGRSYLLLKLARAKIKIGRGRFPLLAETIPHRRCTLHHAVEANLEALKLFDVPPPPQPELVLPARTEDRRRVSDLLAELGVGKEFVVLAPGGTWPSKCWPVQHWASLAQRLLTKNFDVVLIGSRSEEALGSQIMALLHFPPGIFPLFGSLNLRELYHLFQMCALTVSGDTGPLHIAAAARAPLVALYGPTDPIRTGPWRAPRSTVLTAPDCSQCRLPRCGKKCMNRLNPSAVIEAALSTTLVERHTASPV